MDANEVNVDSALMSQNQDGTWSSQSEKVYFSNYVPSSSGTARDIQVYMNTFDESEVANVGLAIYSATLHNAAQVAIYTADNNGYPNSFVDMSLPQNVNTNSTNAWISFNMTQNAQLTAGTTYCLCVVDTCPVQNWECQVEGNSIGPGNELSDLPNEYVFVSSGSSSNFGTATMNGSLSSVPTARSLSQGSMDIFVDYCQQ